MAPTSRGGEPAGMVGVIAFVILVLELTLIRLIPAEVHAISYFTNLVLIAAFFGLGLGCILQRQRDLGWLLPAGLLAVLGFVLGARGIVVYPGSREVHYWLADEVIAGEALRLPLVLAAAVAFVTSAVPFVALGQALARAMDRHPRLVAYGWDIAGSLAGTLVFTLFSFLRLAPWVWPPVLLAVWALLRLRAPLARLVHVAAGLAFLILASSPHHFQWSPYYYVQYTSEESGIRVFVNSSFHQLGIDFTSSNPHHRQVNQTILERWSRPYRVYRDLHDGEAPGKVLILGAGTGNDVAVALANEVEEVVAVEIDPVILELGLEHNATHPYASSNVRTRVDDARNYLRNSDERFDLIVFGTLDSQSLLSGHANLRLENYVYTREAFDDARKLLEDRGVLAVFYSVHRAWLYSRIYSTVRAVFGEQTRLLVDESHLLFNATIIATNGVPEFRDQPQMVERFGGGLPSIDDWPFIYLERPGIGSLYWKLFAVIGALIVAVFLLLRRLHPVRGLHLDFLFLGLGFTLVESSSIVRMTLLFGSTWVINAIVFSAVLLTIFLANWSVLAGRAPSLRLAWIGLLVSIAVNFLLPVDSLFDLVRPLRVVASAALIGTPVYFAAVCFSRLFARQRITGYALGINLVGAMAGGVVEYCSMAIGMRQVWLVILAVYALAWLTSTTFGRDAA